MGPVHLRGFTLFTELRSLSWSHPLQVASAAPSCFPRLGQQRAAAAEERRELGWVSVTKATADRDGGAGREYDLKL